MGKTDFSITARIMRIREMVENRMVVDSEWERHYKVFAHCCVCGDEILADGSTYYDFDGDIVCSCCKDEYVDFHFMKRTEVS